MYIYKIRNKINNKLYVGQTVKNIFERFNEHCYKVSNCRFLKKAINKYGKENFEIGLVEVCSSLIELDSKEEFWIKELNTLAPNGYNLTTGGAAPKHSDITKKKMSQTRKGKIPYWTAGKGHTEEANRRRSESLRRLGSSIWTEEARNNARLGASRRFKKIQDQNENTYESITDAARKTGCHRSAIQKVLKGEYKQASNKEKQSFVFKHIE